MNRFLIVQVSNKINQINLVNNSAKKIKLTVNICCLTNYSEMCLKNIQAAVLNIYTQYPDEIHKTQLVSRLAYVYIF